MRNNLLILFLLLAGFELSNAQDLFFEKNKVNISPDAIVASIDTFVISAEEFFYNYEFGPTFPKRQQNSKLIHLNFMINEKLLAQEGYKNGMLNKEDVKNMYTDINSDLATEELFKDEILSKIKINNDEIRNAVTQKKIELNIRWIYSSDETKIKENYYLLTDKALFDSLFNMQLNDTVFKDQREMDISLFDLNKKNPALSKIILTLKVGDISGPIKTGDGWYIVKLDNKISDMITTESENNKLWKEAEEAVTMHKMDSLSDSYVNNVLFENHPTIKRDAFNILRSYLGKYILTPEKYNQWQLDQKFETALENLGLSKSDEYPGIILIESLENNYSLDDFLNWYNNRQLYIKFNENDLRSYSISLENIIWQMLRDKLLAGIAEKKNYYDNSWVKQQSKWWEDKIVYSALRNEYSNSIALKTKEINGSGNIQESNSEKISQELSEKILHKVLELKNNHKIKIFTNVLDKIIVSSENDKKAIDFYSVKKGSLIPRPAYPSIDPDWANWQ